MLGQYSLQILVIESSSNDIEAMLNELRQGGCSIASRRIRNSEQLQAALTEREWDMLLCATTAEDLTFQEACAGLADANADLAVVVIYDGTVDDASRRLVDSLSFGAMDAVDKSNPAHLELVLGRELAHLSERRTARQWRHALEERERHWHALLEASRDPIAYVHGGMHIHANPSYLEMFGYDSLEDLESLPILDLVVPEDQGEFKEVIRDEDADRSNRRIQAIEVGGLRSDGNRIDVRMEISAGTFGGEDCWQVVIRDRTDSTEIAAQLDYLRHHDPLTGLSNRQSFIDSMQASLAYSREHDDEVRALLYVALDNFNLLRESAGVTGSDRIVVEVAKLFRERIPSRFKLARFGDSIFTVLFEGASLRAAMDAAERLRASLDGRILEIDGGTISTTCSIGICPISAQTRGVETVLAQAQKMARLARKEGGNRVEVLSIVPEAARPTRGGDHRPTLQIALEAGRLGLMYQPIINLRETSMELYEVSLGRYNRSGDMVPTDNLFETDLEAELLHRVDQWLVDQSVEVLRQQVMGGRDTHFFVKLSEQSLADEQMVLFIGKRLRNAHLAGRHLILEVSEAAAVSQVRSAKAFSKGLRELQCLAALQNLGTGLSSLNTLKMLEVDYFKIDPALVQTLSLNPESQSAVRSIVEAALSLDKRAIAAGVEEAATLAMLWDIGVHYAQGSGIRAPGPELEWDFEASEIGG